MSYVTALHLVPNQIRSQINTVPTPAVACTRPQLIQGGGGTERTPGLSTNGAHYSEPFDHTAAARQEAGAWHLNEPQNLIQPGPGSPAAVQ